MQCTVKNSPSHKHAPLLSVMQYYSQKVNPYCPQSCSCHFYHFMESEEDTEPYYTVLVNCSGQGLVTFPALPGKTTVLDLSHNLLGQAAYNDLNVVGMNYANLESRSPPTGDLTVYSSTLSDVLWCSSTHTKGLLQYGTTDSLVTMSSDETIGHHAWLPYDRNTANYFYFERDATMGNGSKVKRLPGPFIGVSCSSPERSP